MISLCFFQIMSTIIFEPHGLVAVSIKTQKIRLSCSNGHASIINCYWKRCMKSEYQLEYSEDYSSTTPSSRSNMATQHISHLSQLLCVTSNCRRVVVFTANYHCCQLTLLTATMETAILLF